MNTWILELYSSSFMYTFSSFFILRSVRKNSSSFCIPQLIWKIHCARFCYSTKEIWWPIFSIQSTNISSSKFFAVALFSLFNLSSFFIFKVMVWLSISSWWTLPCSPDGSVSVVFQQICSVKSPVVLLDLHRYHSSIFNFTSILFTWSRFESCKQNRIF